MPYETWCVISIFRQINSFRKIRQIYKTFAFVHGCRHDSVTKLMIDRILSFLLTHVFNYIPPILQPTQHCDKWFIFHPSFILHHIILLGANKVVVFKISFYHNSIYFKGMLGPKQRFEIEQDIDIQMLSSLATQKYFLS